MKTSNSNSFLSWNDSTITGPPEDVNIFVIGETGVGKSTWINGLANYFTFNTLQDAMASESLPCLIPMNFNVTTGADYCQTNIVVRPTVGPEDASNTIPDASQSQTQIPRIYKFHIKRYIFNFMDTSGVGDTRGIHKDQENMKALFRCLSRWSKIHLICFLLKPHESRLKPPLRYCLEEVLTRFHHDCIPNMAFVFTNASSTLFRFGDTLTVLKAMFRRLKDAQGHEIPLKNENTFMVDNEAVRFLYARNQGVELDERHIVSYEKSWNHTTAESYRLLEYAASLEGHEVKLIMATHLINDTFYKLSKVLVEINEKIQRNRKLTEVEGKLLLELKDNLKVKEADVYTVDYVKNIYQDFSNVVCGADSCIESIRNPDTKVSDTYYKKVCCHRCLVDNVKPKTSGDPQLRNCSIFNAKGDCSGCGCSWQCHIQIPYTQQKASMSVPRDPDAIEILKREILEKQKKLTKLDPIKLEKEYDQILKSTYPFFESLKAHSLVTLNTAFEEYATISLEYLENSPNDNQAEIRQLKKMIAIHQQQKYIAEKFSNSKLSSIHFIYTETYEKNIARLKDSSNARLQEVNFGNASDDDVSSETIEFTPKINGDV